MSDHVEKCPTLFSLSSHLSPSHASFWMIAELVANEISDPVFKAITLDIVHVYLV